MKIIRFTLGGPYSPTDHIPPNSPALQIKFIWRAYVEFINQPILNMEFINRGRFNIR